jgi:5-(carboxyamino)imidazole ribonucleotide mutase
MRAIDRRGCFTFYYLINSWFQPGTVLSAEGSDLGRSKHKAAGVNACSYNVSHTALKRGVNETLPASWRFAESPYNVPMSESKPLVAIIMGSKSDWETMRNAVETLDGLGIANEARVLSAHRTPEATADFARGAADRGLRVIIAGAGGAAHLAGVIAAHTWLPVLGVPIQSKLQGLDSLLSTAQMPGGIPVGTLAIGEAGAKNAALLAAAILATSDDTLRQKLEAFRRKQSETVLAAKLPTSASSS